MSLTIANGMVVTLDRLATVHRQGHVVIDGNKISIVGSEAISEGGEELDAEGAIVVPGLLNAHSHSPETFARGVVDRVSYEDWAPAIWPTIDRLTPAQIRTAVLLGCVEMLHSGTTAVVDHFRQTPMRIEAVEAAVEAYREAGMRCSVAIMLRDRIVPEWVKETGAPIEPLCRDAIDRWHDPNNLMTIMLAPSAPHRCTDNLLALVAQLSDEHGLFVQMHVDETQSQRQEASRIYGHSSIRHLELIGLLNPRVSLAHCVWVDDVDLKLLAGHDVTVVHNPISNLRLGNGVAPVTEMLARNIKIALGTDGAASNDSQNMFEVMKMASLLPGAIGHFERPTVADVLAATTGEIAGRFGMSGVGTIAAGQKADIVVLEADDARLRLLNEVHRQIVFGGAGLQVRHVVIDGRVVVRHGVIQTFDERAVLREADQFVAFRQNMPA